MGDACHQLDRLLDHIRTLCTIPDDDYDDNYYDPDIDQPGYEPVDDFHDRERISRHNE